VDLLECEVGWDCAGKKVLRKKVAPLLACERKDGEEGTLDKNGCMRKIEKDKASFCSRLGLVG
jgi:hypothetical protein